MNHVYCGQCHAVTGHTFIKPGVNICGVCGHNGRPRGLGGGGRKRALTAEQEREAQSIYHEGEKTYAEIAKQMGTSISTVRNAIKRGEV